MSRPPAGRGQNTPGALPCPCGLPRTYADCCGRYHTGPEYLGAPNAEALMRSRYTAYVQMREDYLLATWHPTTRPAVLDLAGDQAKWLGLEIRRVDDAVQKYPPDAPRGVAAPVDAAQAWATVEFVARYKLGGRAHRLRESSRFIREDGRWYYLDGDLQAK